MHCIHCGKETRKNVVFCTNCGRPTKREYNHYACEIYDAISLREKWRNLLANLSAARGGEQHNRSWHSSTTQQTGFEKLLGVNKQKLQDVYSGYFNKLDEPLRTVNTKAREQKKPSISTAQKRVASSEKQDTANIGKMIWIVILIVSAIVKILAGL